MDKFAFSLYIIYVADLQLWLKYVHVTTYADDTCTSVSHRLLSKVKMMLEEDAKNVLRFMASNGLVANASKTALIFLNLKHIRKNEQGDLIDDISVRIGDTEVLQESSTKLLGIKLDHDQKWNSQITSLVSALNSRLYLIKRLSNSIEMKRLKKIADSLYMSKIRYGIQLYGRVRTTAVETEQKLIGSIQVAQNKLARFLNGNKLTDKIPTSQIYKELNLQSVNQINAQIKLLDVWKAHQFDRHPTKYPRRNDTNPEQRTRSAVTNKLDEAVGGKIITTTCINDAAKLWNGAPDTIKNCVSIYSVKKCIKAYTSTLPL